MTLDRDNLPAAPPPTLIHTQSSETTNSTSYDRNFLISLQTPHARPPHPDRIQSFSKLIRHELYQWGVDEQSSYILDASEASETDARKIAPGSEGNGLKPPSELIFNFKSPAEEAVPVLVDFSNPEPFGDSSIKPVDKDSEIPTNTDKVKASNVFQSFPGASTTTLPSSEHGSRMALTLGNTFQILRLGARLDSSLSPRTRVPDRARSPSLLESLSDRRLSPASSISSNGSQLNAFAAPFPLPNTTPKVVIAGTGDTVPAYSSESSPAQSYSEASLPAPKPVSLPFSLPRKPNAALPPVFVKRETAALPQSMALPDIAPMGMQWEGENGLSGNDKRRRASHLGFAPLPLPRESIDNGLTIRNELQMSSMDAGLGQSRSLELPRAIPVGQARPEHLVKMGQKWRASVSSSAQTPVPT